MSNDKLKARIKELENTIQDAQNKLYVLNEEYVENLKAECEKRIGETYKITYNNDIRSINKGKTYYIMIIDTDEIQYRMIGNSHFNQYQYKVLIFSLDDVTKENPIQTEMRHLYDIIERKIPREPFTSEKISKEDFLDKLKEVQDKWIKNIS